MHLNSRREENDVEYEFFRDAGGGLDSGNDAMKILPGLSRSHTRTLGPTLQVYTRMQATTTPNTNLSTSLAQWQEAVDNEWEYLSHKKKTIANKGRISWWHKVALPILAAFLLYSGSTIALVIGLVIGTVVWTKIIRSRMNDHMLLNDRYEEQACFANQLKVFMKNCDAITMRENETGPASGKCIPVAIPLASYEAATAATAPILRNAGGLTTKEYRKFIKSYRGLASLRMYPGVVEYCSCCNKALRLRYTWTEAGCGHRICAQCSHAHYEHSRVCMVCHCDVTSF